MTKIIPSLCGPFSCGSLFIVRRNCRAKVRLPSNAFVWFENLRSGVGNTFVCRDSLTSIRRAKLVRFP